MSAVLAQETTMKAVVYHAYGRADVLELSEIDKPAPADDEVLVRIEAASVNPVDWHMMTGSPYLLRLVEGLRAPKGERLGGDYAGTVEAVGPSVTRFRPGDEVFGVRNGAFAEYVCVREERGIVHKPAHLTFEQAAALGVAGLTALQGAARQGRAPVGAEGPDQRRLRRGGHRTASVSCPTRRPSSSSEGRRRIGGSGPSAAPSGCGWLRWRGAERSARSSRSRTGSTWRPCSSSSRLEASFR